MALDIINEILKSEKSASDSINETKNAVSQMLSDAEKSGKKLVEDARENEEKRLSEYKKELAEKANKLIENGRIESLAQCELLKNAAKSKLDASADAVCERIMGKKCQ